MSEKTPIPVIGTAIVNSPHWIKRLVDSVDYPTDNFVIFNNNGRGQITKELDDIALQEHPFIKNIIVTHMPSNIGCSGSWNLIIKSFMNSPYWIISNHDVAYTKGFLEEMITKAKDPEVGVVHGRKGDFNVGSWDLFLIKDWVIQEYGLFDENLYPAYGEDVDYIMRFRQKPIKRIMGLDKKYYHGDTFEYYETGEQTKRGEPELIEKLNKANLTNFEYLTKKWGKGWRMLDPYKYPFNNETLPLSTTTYDLKFVRRKHLGF